MRTAHTNLLTTAHNCGMQTAQNGSDIFPLIRLTIITAQILPVVGEGLASEKEVYLRQKQIFHGLMQNSMPVSDGEGR